MEVIKVPVEVIEENRFGVLAYNKVTKRFEIVQQVYDIECLDWEDRYRLATDKEWAKKVAKTTFEFLDINRNQIVDTDILVSADYKLAYIKAEIAPYLPSHELAKIFDKLNLVLCDAIESCVAFSAIVDYVKGIAPEEEVRKTIHHITDILTTPPGLLKRELRQGSGGGEFLWSGYLVAVQGSLWERAEFCENSHI